MPITLLHNWGVRARLQQKVAHRRDRASIWGLARSPANEKIRALDAPRSHDLYQARPLTRSATKTVARTSTGAAKGDRAQKTAAIFRATLEELASADYGGLTFERVALRAGVNKTTLYRRWPEKAALVRDALTSMAEEFALEPTTGSLREDLLRIGRKNVEFATSFMGQSLQRLRLLNHPEPELAAIAKSLDARRQSKLGELAAAAIARGDVPEGTDVKLLLDMFGGALWVFLFYKNERVDDVLIARIADRLLYGVTTRRRPP